MAETQTSKWIGKSLTVWGVIVTVASTLSPVFGPILGWDISPTDIQAAGASITDMLSAIGFGIGSLMTIIGRMRAQGPATLLG